jgi:hypothetical protein
LAPSPFPDSVSKAASSSCLTSFTSAAFKAIEPCLLNSLIRRGFDGTYLICERRLDFQCGFQDALVGHDTGGMVYPRHLRELADNFYEDLGFPGA